mmetsp:Transcript_34628/g.112697  ORF Transcript_34628/g.112697 Transcript_34628/m.112697 type:complete len:239 (+) Transcript_34628:3883-4599(+)
MRFSFVCCSSKLYIRSARKRFKITKLPKSMTSQKNENMCQPAAFMPSYITMFQFSPDKIWKIVVKLQSHVSKWARGTQLGLLPSIGHFSLKSATEVQVTTAPSASNINLPPKKLWPMSAKMQMAKKSSRTKSRIPSTVAMLAFMSMFMLLNFLASLKMRSSRKARRDVTAELPLFPSDSASVTNSTMEMVTMTPSKAKVLSLQYVMGNTAKCMAMNSNKKMILKLVPKPASTSRWPKG